MVSKSLVYVVNTADFFLSHRLPIALHAQKLGFDIHVITAGQSSQSSDVQDIQSYGFTHHTLEFSRSGMNLWREIGCVIRLRKLFLEISPDLVHLVTIKPVLYGGIAARLSKVPSVVAAISGLGSVFTNFSFKGSILRWLALALYRVALRQEALVVIFQNYHDLNVLCSAGAVDQADARIIKGSGVDLSHYIYVDEPECEQTVIVMAARLLVEKGVLEFINAARILKARGVPVEMRLVGAPDTGNPNSVDGSILEEAEKEGIVKLLGHRKDIAYQYSVANIVCLPSYYGEGLPKSLVEAAACGRAVVTTDHPGCRDAVLPRKTGLLVPIKDSLALANTIQELIEDPLLRIQFGKNGRSFAAQYFAVEKIVAQHFDIYLELLYPFREESR